MNYKEAYDRQEANRRARELIDREKMKIKGTYFTLLFQDQLRELQHGKKV